MIYIPFGAGCYTTECLKSIDKRNVAFPFDWCIVDFKFIKHILNHIKQDPKDFSEFLFSKIEKCKWTQLEQYISDESGPAFHCEYNLIYPHHDIINNKNNITNRINRLYLTLINEEFKLLIFDKFCDKKYSYNNIEYNNDYLDVINDLKNEYNIVTASGLHTCDIKFDCNDNWRIVSDQLSKGFLDYEKVNYI